MSQTFPEIELRKLASSDAEQVSELAIRSKAVWGYSDEQMAVFRKELTITGEEIAGMIAFGARAADGLVGYYTVLLAGDGLAELQHIFVDPAHLKYCVGSKLLRHAINECQARGVRCLTVQSDPNAAGFYEAKNATLVEWIPSSIPGRSIPHYRFELVSADFLEASDVVDRQNADIQSLALELREQNRDERLLAQACFEWVRDNIQHSLDFQRTEVTCRASDVLAVGTGYCYAKSHLLAALLRANGIPAGFCYQRLTLDGVQPPHCLHGLNAVYLRDYGWYRIDARGNKASVDAQFTPPVERLAFEAVVDGEFDFTEIFARPLPVVVQSLQSAVSVQTLATCLPDATENELEASCDSDATLPFVRRREMRS